MTPPSGWYRQLSMETRLDFGMAAYSLYATQETLNSSDIPVDAVPFQPATDGTYLHLHWPSTPPLLGNPSTAPWALSFHDYRCNLPDWQQELLAGVYNPPVHDSLGQTLLQGCHLFLCSNGGAKDNTRPFGWVIATSTQMLWECSGIATGWFANSFCSEGIGQLSLLFFLEAYIIYHGLKDLHLGFTSLPITKV